MDNRTKNIYIEIKNHLPEWLGDIAFTRNPIFIDWCRNNQKIFMLIIDDLLAQPKRNITITLEWLQCNNNSTVGKNHNISGATVKNITTRMFAKVFIILKFVDRMSFDQNNNLDTDDADHIKNLDLPTRFYNVLTKNNFYKISQLKVATYKQLKNIHYLGDKAILTIEEKLKIKYDKEPQPNIFDSCIKANIQIEYIKGKLKELHQEIYNNYSIVSEISSSDIEFWNNFGQSKAAFEVLAVATNIPVPPSDYWNSVEYMSKFKFLKRFKKEQDMHRIKICKVAAWMNKLFS